MSPIVGYIAMSLSATYHCTAAVAATGVTMHFGKPSGSARMIAQAMVDPLAPPPPITPAISRRANLARTISIPAAIMALAASARARRPRSAQASPADSAIFPALTSAKSWLCGRSDRSTSHGVAPAALVRLQKLDVFEFLRRLHYRCFNRESLGRRTTDISL